MYGTTEAAHADAAKEIGKALTTAATDLKWTSLDKRQTGESLAKSFARNVLLPIYLSECNHGDIDPDKAILKLYDTKDIYVRPEHSIVNYRVHRGMGSSSDWDQLGIGEKAVKDLNEIGYTGKLKGERMTENEYFRAHVNTSTVKFQCEVEKSNGAEFTDTLLVTKVTN